MLQRIELSITNLVTQLIQSYLGDITMNIRDYLSEEMFESRLLSQLSRKEETKIIRVSISYNLNYVNKYTDEACNRVFVEVSSNNGNYTHGWTFGNPLNLQEVRFCLRLMRKCLKRHLKDGV